MHYPLLAPRSIAAFLLDASCLALAALLAWVWMQPACSASAYAAGTALGGGVLLVLTLYAGAYAPSNLGRYWQRFWRTAIAVAVAPVLLLALYPFVGLPDEVVKDALRVSALLVPALFAEHLVVDAILSRHPLPHRVLLIGTGALGNEIARILARRREDGVEIVGILSADPEAQGTRIASSPVLGWSHEVEKVLEGLSVDRIVVVSDDPASALPAETLLATRLAGVAVESGLSFYERLTGRVYLPELEPLSLVFSPYSRSGFLTRSAKRFIDVAFAVVGLVACSPILLLAAVSIRLDSPGPALYSQQRVGTNGRLFWIWKLRTMQQQAERETGPVYSASDDVRITRVGHILRKSRLDEFPQLWNVLRGDMSLVGPRPERPEFIGELSEQLPQMSLRSATRPGITGWAQTRLGYVSDVEGWRKKLAHDLYYIKHRSLSLDLAILWETTKILILMRGV